MPHDGMVFKMGFCFKVEGVFGMRSRIMITSGTGGQESYLSLLVFSQFILVLGRHERDMNLSRGTMVFLQLTSKSFSLGGLN